jgi:Plavaka transposase
MIVEEFELGVLWDKYGLVGDIIVCILVILFCVVIFAHTRRPQPFTNHFPRADIHELLSPDILHQLIKGAFKDHVVTWVNDYIKARHREKKANEILDDIDQRYIFTIPNSIIVMNYSNDL